MPFLLFLCSLFAANALENMSGYQYLWEHRDQSTNTEKALSQLQQMSTQNPNDYDLCWNLARFYYWSASSSSDSSASARLAKKGLEAAEQAKKINPAGIEGWYWATANIGTYAEASGTFVTVSEDLSTRYKTNAEKAIQLESLYDDGGPYRSLGIYYTKLPWPLQDLEKAEELLLRSLKENPNRALSLYYYAEVQIQNGDVAGGKQTLQKILSLDPYAGNTPEIHRYQPKARQRLQTLQ